MIQRIQSLYLVIAITLLSIVSVGLPLFAFANDTSIFEFSSFGITEYGINGNKVVNYQHYPIYIGTIALTLLSFICLMSYKNLERQFKLGRTIFYLYFVMLITVVVLTFVGDSLIDAENLTRHLGTGFFLFVAGFPFIFLANTGIKRDKNLLKSLDRLR